MNQQLSHNVPPQSETNGDQVNDPTTEENNSQQFSWITDTIVVNGNQVRVIFPDLETSN